MLLDTNLTGVATQGGALVTEISETTPINAFDTATRGSLFVSRTEEHALLTALSISVIAPTRAIIWAIIAEDGDATDKRLRAGLR